MLQTVLMNHLPGIDQIVDVVQGVEVADRRGVLTNQDTMRPRRTAVSPFLRRIEGIISTQLS
jgi:hypothetical protein